MQIDSVNCKSEQNSAFGPPRTSCWRTRIEYLAMGLSLQFEGLQLYSPLTTDTHSTSLERSKPPLLTQSLSKRLKAF